MKNKILRILNAIGNGITIIAFILFIILLIIFVMVKLK